MQVKSSVHLEILYNSISYICFYIEYIVKLNKSLKCMQNLKINVSYLLSFCLLSIPLKIFSSIFLMSAKKKKRTW